MNPFAKTQWATACSLRIAEARKISLAFWKWKPPGVLPLFSCLFFPTSAAVLLMLISGTLFSQPADIKFDRFDHWPGYSRMAVNTIGQDAHGFLWLATSSGSERFDGNTFESSAEPPPKGTRSNNQLTTTLTDRNGRTWVGAGASLSLKTPGYADRSFALPGGAGGVRAVFFHPAVSGDSVVWVLADSALLCFHIARGRFIRDYRNRSHDVQSLYGAPFRCAFLGREGILWLGGEGGLCKYDWRNQEFRLYNINPGPDTKRGLLNFVQGVPEDSSRCWVTTTELGLVQFDLTEHRLLPEKIFGEMEYLTDKNTYSMAYDKLGRLWVGDASDSIFVVDVRRGKIEGRIPQHKNLIHFISKDVVRGNFWHVLRPEKDEPSIVRIVPETMQMDTFKAPYWTRNARQSKIDYFVPVQNDTIWFVHGDKYIECFSASNRQWTQKPIKAFLGIEPDMSRAHNIRYDAARKALWLMTADSIYRLDWEKETAERYQGPPLRPGQMYMRIHTDDLGRLWVQVSPENILYKLDPERKTTARYDWSDGLPNAVVECLDMDRVGSKWCQRYHNFTFLLFEPEKIPVIPAAPPLITCIRTGNRIRDILATSQSGQIPAIHTTRNDVEIRFTAVAFEQGRHLKFRYRLHGIDSAWVYVGQEREAYYHDLPPGKYRFEVMAANREGDWRPGAAGIALVVRPPLYSQTEFRICCFLLLLGLVYTGFYLWDKKRVAEYRLRLRIAEDLNHEVEMTLGSISSLGSSNSVQTGSDDILTRIEQHQRSAAEKLSELIWFLNPDNDHIRSLIRRIQDHADARLSPMGVFLFFEVEPVVWRAAIPLEKRKVFYYRFKKELDKLSRQNAISTIGIRISRAKPGLKMELWIEGHATHPVLEMAKPEPFSSSIFSED
jgi:streptogramin lyase